MCRPRVFSPVLLSSYLLTFVGRLLFGNFTSRLKDMVTSLRQEADFWEKQGKNIDNLSGILRMSDASVASFPCLPEGDYSHNTVPTEVYNIGLI